MESPDQNSVGTTPTPFIPKNLAHALGRVRYKPGWFFRLGDASPEGCTVRVIFQAPLFGSDSDEVCIHEGRRYWVSHEDTEDEVIRTLLLAVLTAEEHEAREQFLVDEVAAYGPHYRIPEPRIKRIHVGLDT